MASRRPIPLPRQWKSHVKAGVLHAIPLASAIIDDRPQPGQRRQEASSPSSSFAALPDRFIIARSVYLSRRELRPDRRVGR